MSYNIDSIDILTLNAWMVAKDVRRLLKRYEDKLPECNFLADLVEKALDIIDESGPDARVELSDFEWRGQGSGHAYHDVLPKLAPAIHGRVEAILTWEGGDSHSGFTIEDGEFTECDVEMTLVPKRGR